MVEGEIKRSDEDLALVLQDEHDDVLLATGVADTTEYALDQTFPGEGAEVQGVLGLGLEQVEVLAALRERALALLVHWHSHDV